MITWFKNKKISTKLIIGFVIVAIIAGIVGAVAIVSLVQIGEEDKELYEENTLGLAFAGHAEVYYQRIRFNGMKALLIKGTQEADNAVQNMKDYSTQVDNYFTLYEEGIITETDRKNFDTLKALWDTYKSDMDKAISFIQAGKHNEAQDLLLGAMANTGTGLQSAFDTIFDYNEDGGQVKSDSNQKLINMTVVIMIFVVVVGIIIAISLGLGIARIISRPVSNMAAAAKSLAKGDVNVTVDNNTSDEIGILAKAFGEVITATKEQANVAKLLAEGDLTADLTARSENDLLGKSIEELVEKLNQIVETIVLAAGQVASGSNLVADSSMALSQGATEQASSVEELTASLQEIAAQTTQNAENADTASKLAAGAQANAIEGNNQMQHMLGAMADINESSNNINKIIKVIDDIAFQTNILALNAAVEAARAGQHGKGFAVVAEEVRNLAAKSANAAKETTELIEDSIRKVDAGTKLAQNTAEALKKIVEQVSKAADVVNSISVASAEQSSGVEQINQGIIQISQVVQSNAASSEESAAASEELSSQASQLQEIVGIFKLKKNITVPSTVSHKSINRKKETPQKIALLDKDFGKY